MNIVIIVNNFPPISDGVGDYSFFLCKELAKSSHKVTIICNERVPRYFGEYDILPIVKRWDKQYCDLVLTTIKKINPDQVCLQYVPFAFSSSGMPLEIVHLIRNVYAAGIITTVFFHEVAIRYSFTNPKHIFVAIVQRYIARELCKNAKNVITSIDKYQLQLQQMTNRKVHKILIPPNFDTSIVVQPQKIKELKNKIRKTDCIVIGLFGLRDSRFINEVLEAIVRQEAEVCFLICGSNQLNSTDFPFKEKLYFTNFLPHEQVYEYLSCCDVFWAADKSVANKGGTSNKSGSLAAALFVGVPVVAIKGDMNNSELLNSHNVYFEDAKNILGIATRLVTIGRQKRVATNTSWQNILLWTTTKDMYLKIMQA